MLPLNASEASLAPLPPATPAPAAEAPKSEIEPTPLLDAAIQRVQILTQQHRESLHSTAAPGAAEKPDVASLAVVTIDAGTAKPAETTRAPDATPPKPGSGDRSAASPVQSNPPLGFPLAAAQPTLAVDLSPPKSAEDISRTHLEKIPEVSEHDQSAEPAEYTPQSDNDIHPAGPVVDQHPTPEITELCLCEGVSGFGAFQPLEHSKVNAGQRVWVYCEMTGLEYEARSDAYISRIATHIELRSEDNGSIAWEQAPGVAEDSCRRPRRDYYVNYRFKLPPSLKPGSYRLRLIQTDLIANRTTSREIPLKITP
jgi:hypothetical protein